MTTRLGTQNGYGITDSDIKCLQLVWNILHSIFYFSFSNASLESIWWTHATNGSLNKFQSGLSSDSSQLLLKKLSPSSQTPWQNFQYCDSGRYIYLNWSGPKFPYYIYILCQFINYYSDTICPIKPRQKTLNYYSPIEHLTLNNPRLSTV